jgi:cytochrome P450
MIASAEEPDENLFGQLAIDDPAAYFGRLRDEAPVHWNSRWSGWIVTRHDDVSACLADARLSADRFKFMGDRRPGETYPAVDSLFSQLSGWVGFMDPPRHLRMRRLVARAFTPRTVSRLEEAVSATADELARDLAERFASGESFDLIEEFAFPFPARIIARLMGVPDRDMLNIKDWSKDLSSIIFMGVQQPGRYDRADRAVRELAEYLARYLDPSSGVELRDGLLRDLAETHDEFDPKGLRHEEVIATCINLVFAGHDTTMNLIGNSMIALRQDPEARHLVATGAADPASTTEELLRFSGPTKTTVRWASEDLVLHDQRIARGDRLLLALVSANRDPLVFAGPERLDLGRVANPHVAFGHGPHFCLGAALARMESRHAVRALHEIVPELELAVPDEQLAWRKTLVIRGVERLPMRLGTEPGHV